MKNTIIIIFLLLTSIAAAQTPIFDLRLEEGSGTSVDDEIGPYTGTVTGAAWTTGRNGIGSALNFPGASGNRITFGDVCDLSSNTFTIMGWIYQETVGQEPSRLIDKQDAESTGYAIWFFADRFAIMNLGSPGSAVSTTAITYNTWQHLAVSCNGSNASFYINGNNAGSPAFSGTATTNAVVLVIGNRADQARAFDGTIDNVKVYSTALTEAQIDSIYTAEATEPSDPSSHRGRVIIIH